VRYYTLVAPDETASSVAAEAGRAAFDFALMSVKVPAQVDRAALVLRKSSGQVAVIENEQWVAPLPDELRSAFSAALARGLQTSDVTSLPRNTARPVVQLTIDVQRFDLYSRHTLLDAVWSARVLGASGAHIATCKASIDEPAASKAYAALVEGQQRAVNAVAAQISSALKGWDGHGSPTCPDVKETARLDEHVPPNSSTEADPTMNRSSS
jgi:uncharacterized lipoprotein YmbA